MPRLSRLGYPVPVVNPVEKMTLARVFAMKLSSLFAVVFLLGGLMSELATGTAHGQETARTTPGAAATETAPLVVRISLADALERARRNNAQFQAALTDAGVAREDRTQARDVLLPSVAYISSGIYTQGGGAGFPVRYI